MVAQVAAPRYLALALASRSVIDTLLDFRKHKKSEIDLMKALRSVAESIQRSGSTESFFSEPAGSPFEHYEQVVTLNEVMVSMQQKHLNVTNALERIITGQGTDEEKTAAIGQTLEFFFALENRALHYYGQQTAAGE